MASRLSQSYQNLPANSTGASALKLLLDGDLEHRSFILSKHEEVQAQYTYAKKAAEVFANCLATTSAAKDAFAASILSTKALEEALKNTLTFYDNQCDILATISSTKGMLATWAEIMVLTEALLTQLDKATPQVEAHLHQAADEHAAHEFVHNAASDSVLSCTDSLRTVDRNIAKKRSELFDIRCVPTDILPQMFIEAVDARQREIITSLSSYHDPGGVFHDLSALSTTFNFVPFTLSATCKRWRAICESTPRLWRYARVPMVNFTHRGNKITGRTQFERCILLSRKRLLELTLYPAYNMTHQRPTCYDLTLLAGSPILRVNIVWHSRYGIPPGIPSPTELHIVASANSPAPYTQVLPTELLANTKKLRCTGLTPWINSAVGIETFHISLSKQGALASLQNLLQNYPRLKELHLDIQACVSLIESDIPFTHQQLHTIFLTGMVLPWVISAFSVGCRLPRLTRLILTDINAFDPTCYIWTTSPTKDQFTHITHIEVQAVSAPSVLAHFRPLFEAATALGTLTLAGNAVEPVLKLISLSAPKRVDQVLLRNSNADGKTLREYLAAIERDGGGTSGMEVTWNDCPNFSGEYGGAFGELRL